MHSLTLAVNSEGWRLYMARKADAAFRAVAQKIFERDQYTCQFCGFQAKEYLEVINLDHNYRKNTFGNMITACPFCAQSLFIESVGQNGYGGGKLIYLPEMTQAELNGFCHVIFCAMTNGTNYRDTAQSIYRSFKFRTQPIEDKYGLGSSNPHLFGQMLLEQKESRLANEILKNIRLLPSFGRFKTQLSHWAEAAASELEEN